MTATANTKPRAHRDIYTKAADILSDPSRVVTFYADGDKFWVGTVVGDHGTYPVFSVGEEYCADHGIRPSSRLGCRCRAGREMVLCSHAIVGEEMRCRGDER